MECLGEFFYYFFKYLYVKQMENKNIHEYIIFYNLSMTRWKPRGGKKFFGCTNFLFIIYYLSLIHGEFRGIKIDFCLFLCLFKFTPLLLFDHYNLQCGEKRSINKVAKHFSYPPGQNCSKTNPMNSG